MSQPLELPHLSVLSFNLLCPAYKRCISGDVMPPSPAAGCSPIETSMLAGGAQRYRESDKEAEWRARTTAILHALR